MLVNFAGLFSTRVNHSINKFSDALSRRLQIYLKKKKVEKHQETNWNTYFPE
jgi:hypothetical protein